MYHHCPPRLSQPAQTAPSRRRLGSPGMCHAPVLDLALIVGVALPAAALFACIVYYIYRRIQARHGSVWHYFAKKSFDIVYHGRRLNIIAPPGARSSETPPAKDTPFHSLAGAATQMTLGFEFLWASGPRSMNGPSVRERASGR